MAIRNLSIRIDAELLRALHRVAHYEGRSVNSQVCILIRQCIARYAQILPPHDSSDATSSTIALGDGPPSSEGDGS